MTDKPTIYAALTAVMEEVQAIGKGDRNNQQGYNFRGIDAVVNAVGPVLRKHRVLVVPHHSEARYRDVQTSTGKPSRECTVTVTYRFYGPAGDHLEATVPGESMDSGDKGAPKAMSVAMRIALLQALCIPTDEPEPDSQSYERAEPTPDPILAAKKAVQNAWEKHRGPFDKDSAAGHYQAWSQGELLANADADGLYKYAAYLDVIEPAQPELPTTEETADEPA